MKGFLIAILSTLIIIGCSKNDNQNTNNQCQMQTVESEMPAMTKFATDSSISYTKDASGLLYQIINPGTGATPTTSSNVTIKYMLRTMDGKGIDSSQNFTSSLNNLILAFKIGVPKIKEGGEIKMIVPSSLAYGCNPYTPLANKPLYFWVKLLSVN